MGLAAARNGAIISADSRQIYRGFDIGTGKPTTADRTAIPHFGVDVAEPRDRWSAASVAAAAAGWLDEAGRAGRTPVVVGGTGFWVSALVQPLADVPPLDPAARARIAEELAALSHADLRARCAEVDPPVAALGHAQWRRAIEVAALTGRRLSDWQRDSASRARNVRYLHVDPGAPLRDWVTRRVGAMYDAGWADEVRALAARAPASAVAWKSCGYERLRAALASGAPPESVRDDIVRETWQYARRQRTWLRRQLKHGPVTQLDPAAPDAFERALAWWDGEDSG
jgi:tRNA dimethylallyltransferase